MVTERLIHVIIFFLLLVGLTVLSAGTSFTYLHSNLTLMIASIALEWGIILIALYVVFKWLGWRWWD